MPTHDDSSALSDSVTGSEVAQPEAGDRRALPPDLDTLLQDLADILAELTGFSGVGISLIGRPDVASFRAVHGWPRELIGREYDLIAAQFPDYHAFCGGEPLVRDVHDPTMLEENRAQFIALGAPRTLAVPIVKDGRLVGTIACAHLGEMRDFTEREISLARAIAAQAAVVIENARLVEAEHAAREESEAESRRMAALYEQLAASNDRVNDIINSITDGFVAVDREWRYLLVNPAAAKMLRTSADDLLGKSMADLYPDISGWPYYRRIMEARQSDSFEVYSAPVAAWLEIHAFPTREGVSILFSDITARKLAERELAEANQRLDAHVGNSPIAIIEFDRDFIITRFSEQAEHLFGWTAKEVLGRPMMEFPWIYEDDVELVARESERLMSGEASRSLNVNRNVRKDGSVRWCEWYSSAIFGEDGELISVFSQVLDITERRDSERFGELLNEIAAAVGSTLEQDVILERLFRLMSDTLSADASALCVRRSDTWELAHDRGISSDAVRAYLAAGRIPPPPTDRTRYAPIVVQEIENDDQLSGLTELGIHRILVVPLLSGGEMVGALQFAQLTVGPEFSEAEIDFAARAMPIATVALDNARLFEREHRIASTLQQAVIATPKPIEGVEAACLYVPASASENVGGDFYDVFELPGHRVAVTIGDVSGKGLGAAQLTSLVRDGIRAYALERPEPAWVLDRANQLLCRSVELGMFATIFLAILDPQRDRLAYSAGGHPPAILFNAEKAEFLDEARSPLVGGFPKAEYIQREITFERDDRLLLYTDGLTEARCDGVLFGSDRLLGTLAKVRGLEIADIPQALLDSAMAFADAKIGDDTAIVCVRRTD